MKTEWFASIDAEKKEEMRALFGASARVRERLTEICNKKMKAQDTTTTSASLYESPNWAFLQADAIGYKRALKEIISLLE